MHGSPTLLSQPISHTLNASNTPHPNNNNAYTHTYTIQNILSASPSLHLQCYTLPALGIHLTHSLTRINSQRKYRESNNLKHTGRIASLTEEMDTS